MTADEIRRARQEVPQFFPRLQNEPFEVTSPRTTDYNCIGWAAGDNQNWWWPGGKYWPGGVLRDDSVAAFIAAFATRGYECCDSHELEPGFEKAALYMDEQHGRVTHAARQLPDGRWTSKLGRAWDIRHLLPGVCGPAPASGRNADALRRTQSGCKMKCLPADNFCRRVCVMAHGARFMHKLQVNPPLQPHG